MKKLCVLFLFLIFISPVFAKVDKTSYEYLKDRRRFSTARILAENIAEKYIEKAFVEKTGGFYKAKFEGYTVSSIKKGIFKYLEVEGKELKIEDIDLPYLKIKTLTDYNRLDMNKKPVGILNDIVLAYDVYLAEDSINQALNKKEYLKVLNKINDLAYPLFTLYNVDVKIVENKLLFVLEYNFPISPRKTNRKFIVKSDFVAQDGIIRADEVVLGSNYKNLDLNKVANLINLLDPLSFTLSILDSKKCKGRVENVKIEDNIIKINGKIYVKGEN